MWWAKKLNMKKIIVLLKIWLTNWVNYLGLCLLIYLAYYCFTISQQGVVKFINLPLNNKLFFVFLFPLYSIIPFTFGYLFFQFLVDSILLFVFKFSIKRTIKIENYIFILTLIVVIFFTLLIKYSENKIDFYEVIKFSLIGVLVLILCSGVYIYTQKKRIKKLKKIFGTKPVANKV